MKVEMFSTQKSAMPLKFRNFDFLPIYKAVSVGMRTYPFIYVSRRWVESLSITQVEITVLLH